MKDESEIDKGTRKSNRQRVPNPFYAEGINELKKAPRPAREPLQKQTSRKRSIVYQDDGDNSEEEPMEEERSELARESNDWYPCKLPRNGQLMKVQFVILQPEQPIVQKKKEEAPKPLKKNETTFDLLSLFQKAIENVNEEVIVVNEKQPENQPSNIKQPKLRKELSVVRQRRAQDSQGKITGVDVLEDRLIVRHSKLGEVQFPVSSRLYAQEVNREGVDRYRQCLSSCDTIRQISIFKR